MGIKDKILSLRRREEQCRPDQNQDRNQDQDEEVTTGSGLCGDKTTVVTLNATDDGGIEGTAAAELELLVASRLEKAVVV